RQAARHNRTNAGGNQKTAKGIISSIDRRREMFDLDGSSSLRPENLGSSVSDLLTHRRANVPQRHANQATHARYATHARTFFLSDFVSLENKGSKIQLPKLKVASSSPVARSKSPQ